jgi:hypothetical protein
MASETAMSKSRYPDHPSHNSNIRTEFFPNTCQTFDYPSKGGMVHGLFTPVELDHLNLSRPTPATRSSSPAEEDALALKMLHLGAHWWPSCDLYSRHRQNISDGGTYDFHFPPVVNVAYPSSGKGLWVLQFSADERFWEEGGERKPYLERKPEMWDEKICFALTMDERCDVLKGFGATFYESVEEYEAVPLTLHDAVEKGNRYEVLLTKMEDPHYVERFREGAEI